MWLTAWAERHARPDDEDGEEGPTEGGDSPWLEEKRKWSARRERQKYFEEKELLVRVDRVSSVYQRIGSTLKVAADQLCDTCSPILSASLDNAETILRQEYPADDRHSAEELEAVETELTEAEQDEAP